MPQPLSRVRADANISIGNNWDNPSDHRPELALLAMKVIAEWVTGIWFYSYLNASIGLRIAAR